MKEVFFQEQREQSRIKSRIVSKYFSAWSKIILSQQQKNPWSPQTMAYIDLFAGPGEYDDESKSTPVLIMEEILTNKELTKRVVTIFNDKDKANIFKLKDVIKQIDGIDNLEYPPKYYNKEIGNEIQQLFMGQYSIPTLFFVDPWGYKGLSLNLISSIISNWGCDCIFFFNYNRINMGIDNGAVRSHMISLFGDEQFDIVRQECRNKTPEEREIIIVDALCDALRNNNCQYVLPFRFTNENGTRTSHHLIFISKSFRGYDVMKDIMSKESSEIKDGVSTFAYNPRDSKYRQGSLLDMLSRPLEDLESMLLQKYHGKTIVFTKLYEEHSVDKPFCKKNYKEVLKKMLAEGKISAENINGNPPREGTFPDDMQVKFGA